MAILHGLSPAPVDRCRVLEIGCNEGANLIPMAYALPRSEFVGFDLAATPVERGQKRINALGLTNIRIAVGDLIEGGGELGHFDYILAHGLYSWVPEPVRDRLLALCGELLTPDGIAYVSYDALPGGHLRRMTREMMLCGVKEIANAEARAIQARGLLQMVLEARPEGDPYRQLLAKQVDSMEKRNPQTIYHDELAEQYHPVLFTEFVEHAGKHGLQYLSEATLPPPDDAGRRPEFQQALDNVAGGDILIREQMMDFARMRVFRETLLCRTECAVRRDFPAEHLRRLQVTSQTTSTVGQAGAREFRTPTGIKLETNHPGVIALLEMLETAWPHALSLEDLEPRLKHAGLTMDSEGAALLMQLAPARMIVFHAWKAPLAERISAQPKASAGGRQEAAMRPYATTLRHATASMRDPIARRLFLLLDGTRDRNALQDAMHSEYPEIPSADLGKRIEQALDIFYQSALLEA